MAITREQFSQITKAIEDIIGEQCPVMIVADTELDIHAIVISGEIGLPISIYMSHAITILSTRHAMQLMDQYKDWLLKQAQSSGTVMPTPKGEM